jgi:hypothetical protein
MISSVDQRSDGSDHLYMFSGSPLNQKITHHKKYFLFFVGDKRMLIIFHSKKIPIVIDIHHVS